MNYDAFSGEAVWTGLGTDDRWVNPDNWKSGQLPGENDDVVVESEVWQEYPGERNLSVTIDSQVAAKTWQFHHYSWSYSPFETINILEGASFRAENVYIDTTSSGGTVQQTGGSFVVTNSLGYGTFMGNWRMSGGNLYVGNTFDTCGEYSNMNISGGVLDAGTLLVGQGQNYAGSFHLSGNAQVKVRDALRFAGDALSEQIGYCSYSFSAPIHFFGADFQNEIERYDGHMDFGFNEMHLIFDGGIDNISQMEVASTDLGNGINLKQIEGFGAYDMAINTLEIGGEQPAYLQLIDEITNTSIDAWDNGNSPLWTKEALYVDTLIVHSGSVLDLNGFNL